MTKGELVNRMIKDGCTKLKPLPECKHPNIAIGEWLVANRLGKFVYYEELSILMGERAENTPNNKKRYNVERTMKGYELKALGKEGFFVLKEGCDMKETATDVHFEKIDTTTNAEPIVSYYEAEDFIHVQKEPPETDTSHYVHIESEGITISFPSIERKIETYLEKNPEHIGTFNKFFEEHGLSIKFKPTGIVTIL